MRCSQEAPRKFGALLLVVVLMLSLSVTAFADGTDDAAGTQGSNDAIKTVTENTITLNKTLIVFNPEAVNVYEPNVQYTYTVAPFTVTDGDATVTDDNEHTVNVKSGVPDGLSVKTNPEFKNDNTVAATAKGTLVEKEFTLEVNPGKFPAAGVYRYKLTETNTTESLNNVGITRASSYNTTRFIDLYVTNKDGGGLEVNTAVVFVSTDDAAKTNDITPETTKTTGFNEGKVEDGDYTNDTAADHYYTYNLKVEKTITGDLADLTHGFPFAVTIEGIKAGKITFKSVDGDVTDLTVTENKVTKGELTDSSEIKLANGQSVTFYGMPFGATATVSEYNDTYDTYTAKKDDTKTTDASTTVQLSADVKLTAKTASAKAELANIRIDAGTAHSAADNTQSSAKTTVASFTNDLESISPTGVVVRFAPYALILSMGLFLLVFSRKSRKDGAEA